MKRTVLFAAIAAMVLPGLFSCNGNDNENDSPSKIYTTPEYDLTSTSQKPVFILDGGIPSFLRWLAHGMSHLEATASPLTLVFVIILTPTRGRSRTTTATRFGHGCRCINHIKEEKHTYMRNVLS